MKILFTSYYRDKSIIRQKELDLCLEMNIKNTNIEKIYIFLEGIKTEWPILDNPKINVIESERPTYKMFFDFINQTVNDEDISLVANTDIFFDETLSVIDRVNMENICFALSRWHYNKNGSITLHREKWSQDTWIFKGKIKHIDFCSFHLGERGCDNRIAYELNNAGYTLINPAETIRTIHYHLSDLHNYGSDFIPRPYLPIEITK